jgi:hypothetical protein
MAEKSFVSLKNVTVMDAGPGQNNARPARQSVRRFIAGRFLAGRSKPIPIIR